MAMTRHAASQLNALPGQSWTWRRPKCLGPPSGPIIRFRHIRQPALRWPAAGPISAPHRVLDSLTWHLSSQGRKAAAAQSCFVIHKNLPN